MPHSLVAVEKHQFHVVGVAGLPTSQERAPRRLGLGEGVISVYTERASGPVPLSVFVVPQAPVLDLVSWSAVFQTHLEVRSASLRVVSLSSHPAYREMALDVEPGSYQALVAQGGLDTCTPDGSDGADHHAVWLWPGPERPLSCAKAHASRPGPRREALLDFTHASTMVESPDPHACYTGMAELGRLATPEAWKNIQRAATEDAPEPRRMMAVQVHALALQPSVPSLQRFAADGSPAIRLQVVRVMGHLLRDWEFGRIAPLDSDAAYALLNTLASDEVSWISREATAALTRLDGLCSR